MYVQLISNAKEAFSFKAAAFGMEKQIVPFLPEQYINLL
jgi:hypothetical protein